jgi:GAF domain-containing protein
LNNEMLDASLDDITSLGDAVEGVLRELRGSVPYDSASVQELRGGGRLVIVAGIGFADMDVILGESFDVNNTDTPNGEVVFRRRPFIVADTEKYRAFRRGLHVGAGIRSWLGVPLIEGEHLLGMIALDKEEPDFYTHEHERAAMPHAARIAAAMARFRS